MADAVLGAVLSVVFEKLASPEVVNFFKSSKLDISLVTDLKNQMLAAGQLLHTAEDKRLTDELVKKWLDELKHWFYRAEEVVDELHTETIRHSMEVPPEPESFRAKVFNSIPAFSSTSSFAKTMNPKMKEVVTALKGMLEQKDVMVSGYVFGNGGALPREQTTCVPKEPVVYGRDEEKKELVDFLLSDVEDRQGHFRIGVAAIVGMGGLGKTTLAKQVYNDKSIQGAFDLKVWVCLSHNFDVPEITKRILESIPGQSCSGSGNFNLLQNELQDKLKDKRFLIVLDDAWDDIYKKWETLRAPFLAGANGSKVIVTTRDDKVASSMRAARLFPLKGLSESDGWHLLSEHASSGGNPITNPSLKSVGIKLIQKCKGLPLAIKALGGVLQDKQDIEEWESVLGSSMWNLPPEKNDVAPALSIGYYYLPRHLRRCFAYCALFPKDYEIEREKLVLLWMAEDFMSLSNGRGRIEAMGVEYLDQLISKSFFEREGEHHVKMHDLMHDLAEFASGDFLLRCDGNGDSSSTTDRARHFSYVPNSYDTITKFEGVQTAKHLRTFLQLRNTWRFDGHLSKIVPEEEILLQKIYTTENPADMLTKVVTRAKFEHCLDLVNIIHI